ncbi:hypothetical protein R75465_08600 [Paraburkholderia aspalathi]|nr:hypothetical protein R75465_08600 [Paraburkholderia aspalathi]
MPTVTNYCQGEIGVAINEWGSGDTDYFGIKHGGNESWDRSDGRGFVMRVKTYGMYGGDRPFFIYANDSIDVSDGSNGPIVKAFDTNTNTWRTLNIAGNGGNT